MAEYIKAIVLVSFQRERQRDRERERRGKRGKREVGGLHS